MTESTKLVDLVQSRIDEFIDARTPIVAEISRDLAPLLEFSRRFLSGGKRFRALFAYWGWQSVSKAQDGFDPFGGDEPDADLSPIVAAASALELFHAAALIHDDIIDNSDTRRGAPAAHRLFESLHTEGVWSGNGEEYGRAAAILLGDLMLGWSDELLDEALRPLFDADAAHRARLEFNRMRTQVIAGQYLDILEERAWMAAPEDELLDRAERVIIYKSAKYSVQAPLAIGAALGGATEAQLDTLRAYGLPLGIAYQLRDDLLGVFGDSSVTGKPSGDDLREGKRTMLVAIARQNLPNGPKRVLDELLGDPDLTVAQIELLQSTIRECGAVERIEEIISQNVTHALAALENAPISRRAGEQLRALAQTVTKRSF